MSKKKPKRAPSAAKSRANTIAGVPVYAPTPERMARGEVVTEPVIGLAPQGDRAAELPPRKVVMGYVVRDRAADVRVRLGRFRDLGSDQIEAGARLERDWEISRLEARMTGSLIRASSGRVGDLASRVIDARDRVHRAFQAVRLGGAETARIVEAVVLGGRTSAEAGAIRYADPEKGRVHAAALLGVGLNLLVEHYRARREMAAPADIPA